ncbi:MAG TPA: hypothetical protein VH912_04940, partial [Streptosporangiaceae bacterium]
MQCAVVRAHVEDARALRRLVNADSGVNCCDSLPDNGEGDIYDNHTYVGPGSPIQQGSRAAVDG